MKMLMHALGIKKLLFLVLIYEMGVCYEEMCDRRPLGTKTAPLPPDNRFVIEIIGISDRYIPKNSYPIKLFANDNKSTFIAFTISAREDTKYNEKNPRKPIALDPGLVLASPDSYDAISSPICNNTVIQSNITPKTSVQAIWLAPPKENKCVTIYALVAVKPDVWYSYEGPLSKRVCEDRRKADDMQPSENDDCRACEEARYQLTFRGMWSYNTHPLLFPASKDLARFSDVVGASHSKDFNVYKYNGDASEGLRMLAEQGNTTNLELEIQRKLGTYVRTVIKATGRPKPNMTTTTTFRTSRKHHLVSLVSAIIPSPDWFLGVANLELCEVRTGQWAKSIRLNVYPLDAGTDSGLDFESPNEAASPPQPISSAEISKRVAKESIKPFARLEFDLIRTYSTAECSNELSFNSEDSYDEEKSYEPRVPGSHSTEETVLDPSSPVDCPMTSWEEWLPCEGECDGDTLRGFQTRFRYHVVDGVVVGKYIENGPSQAREVPQYCLDHHVSSETRECEDVCSEEVTAQRRIWR